MQCFHCSGPEAIKLPHAVPFAKAHCCRFTANMISPLTAVISRSSGPVWLWSLTLCQSKLVILQYWLLLSPHRVLSKNKHSFVYALCLHENRRMLSSKLLHTSATCHLWAHCPFAAMASCISIIWLSCDLKTRRYSLMRCKMDFGHMKIKPTHMFFSEASIMTTKIALRQVSSLNNQICNSPVRYFQ